MTPTPTELPPLDSVPASQRWFWSERWQRMEREADEDVDDLPDALDR